MKIAEELFLYDSLINIKRKEMFPGQRRVDRHVRWEWILFTIYFTLATLFIGVFLSFYRFIYIYIYTHTHIYTYNDIESFPDKSIVFIDAVLTGI